MKRKPINTDEVIRILRKKQGERSLRQFAVEIGISAPYLSDIYRKRRDPGKKVLGFLGLSRKLQQPVEHVYEVTA